MGTTTPLYSLLLGAASMLRLDIPWTSFFVNLLADVGTLLVVYSVGRQLKLPFLGLLVGLFIAISSEYAYYTVSGMETALYICIMLSAFWASLKRRWKLTAVLCALLVLTRLDGLIFVAALAAAIAIRRERIVWLPLTLFTLTLLPWVIFSVLYFGSPLPQSMIAKGAWGLSLNRWASAENFLAYFTNTADVNTGSDKSLLFAGLATLGMGVIARERRFDALRPYLLWGWLYSLAFIVANVFTFFPWYFIPLYPLYFMCVLIGFIRLFEAAKIAQVWRRIFRHWPSVHARWVPLALMFLLLMGIALSLPARVASHSKALAGWTAGREGAYRLISEMIVQSSSATTTICAQEIGALGYFSDRTIVDAGGLVSPGAVGKTLLQVMQERQPEWCVINVEFMPPLWNDSWFRQAYELELNRKDRGEAIEVYRRLSRPQPGK